MQAESTLVLETSGMRASWAHFEGVEKTDGAVLSQAESRISQCLIPSLKDAKVRLPALDHILVGVGPGSFSGIRVAIAAAQGLARASGARVTAIRSCDALGIRFPGVSFLGVFSDARRNSFFFTAYEMGVLSRPSRIYPLGDLEKSMGKCSLAVSTDGLAGVPRTEAPDAGHLYQAYLKNGVEKNLPLEPVYLHPPLARQSSEMRERSNTGSGRVRVNTA